MGNVIAEAVITGGGASGKTSSQSRIKRWAVSRPFRVIFVPETASLVINAAAPDIAKIFEQDKDLHGAIERSMFILQMNLRQRALELATAFHEDCLILYDRAEMDVSTYMLPHQFDGILDELGLLVHEVRDKYDFIIHLETSAKRVPQYYGYDNPARWETPQQAIESDDRTLKAWSDHPDLHVLEGREDFEDKMRDLIKILEEKTS